MFKISSRIVRPVIIAFLGLASHVSADSAPFKTTWQNLTPEQRRTFIAGYLKGSGDANEVLQIVSEYVRENPDEAVSGIERLKQIYSLRDLDPNALSEEITRFFKEPGNTDAGLALAVNSAKQKLRGVTP